MRLNPARWSWANLFSFRFYFAIGFMSLLTVMPLVFIPALAEWSNGWSDSTAKTFGYSVLIFWGIVGLALGGSLDCPKCGKNVKVGYSTCHHCGFDQEMV